jgi:hypothetical protein
LKTQIICLILFVAILNSCSSDKHQLFSNIEINGTIEQFADELAKNGFTDPSPVESNQIRMKGKFVGKDSELFIYGTDSTRTAYKVKVDLPVENSDSLQNTYEKCQELCSSLHGPGTKRYQQFNNSSRFLFNEPKIAKEIKPGDYTRFTTKTGTIYLVVRTGVISVIFLDHINYELKRKESASEDPEYTN